MQLMPEGRENMTWKVCLGNLPRPCCSSPERMTAQSRRTLSALLRSSDRHRACRSKAPVIFRTRRRRSCSTVFYQRFFPGSMPAAVVENSNESWSKAPIAKLEWRRRDVLPRDASRIDIRTLVTAESARQTFDPARVSRSCSREIRSRCLIASRSCVGDVPHRVLAAIGSVQVGREFRQTCEIARVVLHDDAGMGVLRYTLDAVH
jgi:hypothetical protein